MAFASTALTQVLAVRRYYKIPQQAFTRHETHTAKYFHTVCGRAQCTSFLPISDICIVFYVTTFMLLCLSLCHVTMLVLMLDLMACFILLELKHLVVNYLMFLLTEK